MLLPPYASCLPPFLHLAGKAKLLGGFDPEKQRAYVMYVISGGGYGGSPEGDGLSNGCSTIGISKTTPIEIMEQLYPVLFEELASRGYADEDLEKIAGRNVLRVMRESERTGTRLQAERPPSKATIEDLDTA